MADNPSNINDGRLAKSLHAHVIYPGIVYSRGEGAVFARLRELRATERLTSEELLRRQDRYLASLLNYAAERCPHYRTLWPFKGPTTPEYARECIRALPFLTKRDLQQSQSELRARPFLKRTTRKTTGGSTGEPVTVLKDRRATAHEMAASWLGHGWFGVTVGDRGARFWGSPFTFKRRVRFAAADFAMHRIRFSAFAFDEADLERYWRRCLKFSPDYFYGYASMLETFAAFLADRGYDGRRLGLKSIISTAEVLSPPQRRTIEDTFGAPVQNEYGCGEVGPIAFECERGKLHVMTENLLVEVLDPDGKPVATGERGEVVVTDLNNRAMPLIRYRLGDFAVPGSSCSCGRGFMTLDKVWGRAYDFVKTPDGRRYHGEFFMYLFEDLREEGRGVSQFQITQHGPTTLDVAIVKADSLTEDEENSIRTRLEERLSGMRLTLRRVGVIPRARSGKMRIIRNVWLSSETDGDGRS